MIMLPLYENTEQTGSYILLDYSSRAICRWGLIDHLCGEHEGGVYLTCIYICV